MNSFGRCKHGPKRYQYERSLVKIASNDFFKASDTSLDFSANTSAIRSAAKASIQLRRIYLPLSDCYLLIIAVLLGLTFQEEALASVTSLWKFISGALFVGINLVCFYVVGLYDLDDFIKPLDEIYRITKGSILTVILVLLSFLALGQNDFAIYVLLLINAISWAFIIAWHQICRKILPDWPKTERLLLLSDSNDSRKLAHDLAQDINLSYKLVGCVVFNDSSEPNLPDTVPTYRETVALSSLARNMDVSVIALSGEMAAKSANALADCRHMGMKISSVLEVSEKALGRLPLSQASFLPFVPRRSRLPFMVAKRLLDIAIALFGFVILLLIFLPVMVAIKLTSPGPVFYSQMRCGKDSNHFKLYKFRTMLVDSEPDGPRWADETDSRVTPFGRFLRRTHIDEMPQFYNVLLGDLALVGPRPERPELTEMLQREIPFFECRHILKPGITGWAQVNGSYASSVEGTKRKLEYDIFYIKNMCFFLDMVILLKTAKTMFQMRGH